MKQTSKSFFESNTIRAALLLALGVVVEGLVTVEDWSWDALYPRLLVLAGSAIAVFLRKGMGVEIEKKPRSV